VPYSSSISMQITSTRRNIGLSNIIVLVLVLLLVFDGEIKKPGKNHRVC